MSAIVQHRNVPPSLAARMQSMGAALQRTREKAKEQEAIVIRTLVCGSTGALIGYVDGRHDKREVMGMAIPLIAGVVGHGLGFSLGGSNASYSHAVGDAGVAVYGNNFMKELGVEARKKANQPAQSVFGT